MYADNIGDSVINRSPVIIHGVAQLEIHDYPAFIHSCSLSTGDAETSCNSREVSRMAGRACTIPMCYWDPLQGWCRWSVPPAWLPPVGSVPTWGLTGSAAAAACSRGCAHLWSAELKIQVAIEAGSDFSFCKMQMLATVLKFHVEYSSVCVCVHAHSVICNIRLEALKQNAFVSFVFSYLTTADVILLLFVNLSLLAAESQKKATDNKYSPLSTQKAVDHWNDNQKGNLF